jgi:hypothetical protein
MDQLDAGKLLCYFKTSLVRSSRILGVTGNHPGSSIYFVCPSFNHSPGLHTWLGANIDGDPKIVAPITRICQDPTRDPSSVPTTNVPTSNTEILEPHDEGLESFNGYLITRIHISRKNQDTGLLDGERKDKLFSILDLYLALISTLCGRLI